MQRYIFLFQDQGEREDFEATVLFHAPEFCLFLSLAPQLYQPRRRHCTKK